MNKFEQFHDNLQKRRYELEKKSVEASDKITVSELYELSLIDALDGHYDDDVDILNMAIAVEKLYQLFLIINPCPHAPNT